MINEFRTATKPRIALQIIQREFPFQGYIQSKETYLDITNTVLRWLKPGAKILDFGAGPCDKTAIISLIGFKCTACDDLLDDWHTTGNNKEKILAFAQKMGITYKIIKDNNFLFKKCEFDMVMMHDVLEHLHNSPCSLLNDLLVCVKPEGYLFVTVPNAVNLRKRISVLFGKTNLPAFESYYWYPGIWRGHIREYVRDDLVKLSNYLNMEILELHSCHHMIRKLPVLARHFFSFLTLIFPGFRDTWLIVAKKRPNWRPKKYLPRNELSQILSRFTSYRY